MREDKPSRGTGPAPDAIAHPAQLAVGIVGAGRVGTAMGVALARAGHRIVAVSAVSDTALSRIGRSLPAVPVLRPDEVISR
ncbi:MAG: oxidoreductase, partial [Streptosporangiaceae bacterium]